jgi:ferritin-like metal-binding protein YciE
VRYGALKAWAEESDPQEAADLVDETVAEEMLIFS